MGEIEEFIKSRISLYNHYKETFKTEDGIKLADTISKQYQYELKKLQKQNEEKGTVIEPIGLFEFFE